MGVPNFHYPRPEKPMINEPLFAESTRHLEGPARALHLAPVATSPAPQDAFDPAKSYREIRAGFEADFERAYVKWLLDRHDGNISAAAREARMDRKYLYDLARKHGLRGPRSAD